MHRTDLTGDHIAFLVVGDSERHTSMVEFTYLDPDLGGVVPGPRSDDGLLHEIDLGCCGVAPISGVRIDHLDGSV